MRRIFTASILAAACVAASFNSFAQCSLSTTDNGAGGAQNTFTTNTEGFTGDVTWGSQASNGFLVTSNTSTATITTPIYYLNPGQNTILVRFALARTASNSISSYTVTATTFGGTITLCPATSVSLSPNGFTTYYLTIPQGSLPTSTNFQLNISFTQTGSFRVDDFGINASVAAGTLPVKFSSFEAKTISSGINLVWNVAEEENVAAYQVTKSTDGRSYETIGTVNATGETTYSFIDAKAGEATAYYRVKAVDLDGKVTYSAIVTVKGGKASINLRAFPMPVNSELTLQHATASTESQISISTAEGRTVKVVTPANGAQQTVISLASMQPGVYMIRYVDGKGNVETLKIVKQ